MKIAILTFHRANNCGAMLQAWALRTVLERMGHVVEFPRVNHVGEELTWSARWPSVSMSFLFLKRAVGKILRDVMSIGIAKPRFRGFNEFRRRYIPEWCGLQEDLAGRYDVLVVGSDQVWNEKITRSDSSLFFCEKLADRIPCIAYAASCGDKLLDASAEFRIEAAIGRFGFVSFRETRLAKRFELILARSYPVVLDPTLLIDSKEYEKIAEGDVPAEPYLFMYTLTDNAYYIQVAKELSRRLGVRCVIAPCSYVTRFKSPAGLTGGISPLRFLNWSRHARYILSASFHGTVFALQFGVPFLSIREKVDEIESRPESLLKMVGMQERLVNPSVSLEEMTKRIRQPISPSVTEEIQKARKDSINWLAKALGAYENNP